MPSEVGFNSAFFFFLCVFCVFSCICLSPNFKLLGDYASIFTCEVAAFELEMIEEDSLFDLDLPFGCSWVVILPSASFGFWVFCFLLSSRIMCGSIICPCF